MFDRIVQWMDIYLEEFTLDRVQLIFIQHIKINIFLVAHRNE